ncbi:hypothetical protein [Leisingera aquimarina]|uniref:hypothetical protein n=1 Tax=Leisingera aquimarina TaxID=476529 RepID=UPI000423B9F5|nr:hypothetical protein [Leisingera aquimarina]
MHGALKPILTAGALAVGLAGPALAETTLKFATDSGDRDSPSGMALAAWAKAIEDGSGG